MSERRLSATHGAPRVPTIACAEEVATKKHTVVFFLSGTIHHN
jgi:hypothetical protein